MNHNVKVPMDLLAAITRVMLQIDPGCFNEAFQVEYDAVLQGLHKKLASIELRNAYSKIVFAATDDDRSYARTQYLNEKRSSQEDW